MLVGILCLFGICVAQVRPTKKSPGEEPQKTKVYLLHSDILRFNKEQNPDAQILVGNVKFRHDSAYMDCDSAYFYEARNSFEAFGNIKMQQGDTLFVFGDYLFYDGDSQIAYLRNNVRMFPGFLNFPVLSYRRFIRKKSCKKIILGQNDLIN